MPLLAPLYDNFIKNLNNNNNEKEYVSYRHRHDRMRDGILRL